MIESGIARLKCSTMLCVSRKKAVDTKHIPQESYDAWLNEYSKNAQNLDITHENRGGLQIADIGRYTNSQTSVMRFNF